MTGLVIYQLRVKGNFKCIHHFLQRKFGKSALVVFSLLIGIRLFNEVWSNTMVIGNYFGGQGTTPYYIAILVFTGLTLVYSLKGGLRSSLHTDAIQRVFFGILLFLLSGFILPTEEGNPVVMINSREWKISTGLNLLFAALIQVFRIWVRSWHHEEILTLLSYSLPQHPENNLRSVGVNLKCLCCTLFETNFQP